MPPRLFVKDGLWQCLRPRLVRTRGLSSDAFSPPSFQSLARPPPFGITSTTARREKPPLTQIPTHILYEHARTEGARGHFDDVFSICRVLLKDRGETLNKNMYTAVLHSFVSASNGTGGKLRRVLEEMGFWADAEDTLSSRSSGNIIELDARACECVLEVLAVHPDYLLRADVLEYMKTRWFSLSDRAQNFVVAGMLRERHFEHALESLEDMVRRQARVETWLFDKTIWMLLEFGEVEEAFYVLSLREGVQARGKTKGGVKLSEALWGSLLDAAAHKQLHQPVTTVWMAQVQPGYLKPSTGTCLSVLAVASRHGDVLLATDVFRVLTERNTTFATHHYELLIATYLAAHDVSAALSVLLIMVDSNLKVETGTCEPLYWYMSKELDQGNRPMQAFTLLQEFEAAGRKVPTAAVNACMQASIALMRFEDAIEIYKALHTVSQAGPNTHTFNILFKGCHQAARKELAMFFANEMITLGLKPDRITYDRLILVCVQSDDLNDALLYYKEMRSVRATADSKKTLKPRRKTWELLIHKCVVQGDERAVALLKEYKEGIDDPRKRVEKAVMHRFESARVHGPRVNPGQPEFKMGTPMDVEMDTQSLEKTGDASGPDSLPIQASTAARTKRHLGHNRQTDAFPP